MYLTCISEVNAYFQANSSKSWSLLDYRELLNSEWLIMYGVTESDSVIIYIVVTVCVTYATFKMLFKFENGIVVEMSR